jgi:hypothetical protein
MRKYLKVIFLGFLIIVCIITYLFYTNSINEFDIKEVETLNNKIVWNEKTKLKWTDFIYDPNEKSFKIYAKVGLAARYNVYPPILFRSNTTFSTTESIVSDTTDLNDLRIAQAKFDLLETFRIKMEAEVDSFKQLESPNLQPSDFNSMTKRYYSNFENEWESYSPFTIELLYRVEDTIKNRINANISAKKYSN